jgi:hypothetical protein
MNPPIADLDNGHYVDQFQALAANAEADVLQYGLTALGVDPSFVESVCARFMSEAWYVTARTDRASRARSAPSGGYRQKNIPFALELHKTYRHPDHPELTIGFGLYPGTVDVQGESIPVVTTDPRSPGNFPLETWVRIGDRPVAVKVSTPNAGRFGLSATWLQAGTPLSSNAAPSPQDLSRQPPAFARSERGAQREEPAPPAKAVSAEELELLNYAMNTGNDAVEALWWILDDASVPKGSFGFMVSSLYVDPDITRLEWIRTYIGVYRRTRGSGSEATWRSSFQMTIMDHLRSTPKMRPLFELFEEVWRRKGRTALL